MSWPARIGTLAIAVVLSACVGSADRGRELVLASTTSTEDSGLLDVLVPAFEAAYPYSVKVVAVGTGQALELGRRRDADVLLVHAPAAESLFVARGHGVERRAVMYNEFVIVGPASDRAEIRSAATAIDALRRIGEAGHPFVSRGDDSGTHRRELELWRSVGVGPDTIRDRRSRAAAGSATAGTAPPASWYIEAGQGMGEVLRIASEKQAYTLTDRATFLFLRDALNLAVLFRGDPALFNQYGVIPVAGADNEEGGRDFADWITGPGQPLIARYGQDRFGEPLFVPNATGDAEVGAAPAGDPTGDARAGA